MPLLLSFFILFLTSCSSLFYYPSRYLYSIPEKDYGFKHNEFELSNGKNHKLYGWFLTNPKQHLKKKNLYLVLHGNAENMTSHYRGVAWLIKRGDDVLIYDYREYGRSDGKANHTGVIHDTKLFLQHGIKYFHQHHYNKLIIIAQSIGGIVTLKALEELPIQSEIDLLVLDSTFSSFKNIAFSVAKKNWFTWPFSPFVYLFISDSQAPCKKQCNIKIPTLVLHSKNDPIIPYKFGVELFNKLKQPKWFLDFNRQGHIISLLLPEIQNHLIKIVNSLPPRKTCK